MNFFINFLFIGEFMIIINLFIFLIFILLRQFIMSFDLNINVFLKKNYFVTKNFLNFIFFNLVLLLIFFFSTFNQSFFSFFFTIYSNNFIIFLKILTIFFTILILNISLKYIKFDLNFNSFEFYLILILSLLGSFFLISSNDFITFYLSLELQSLAFYVLAGFKQASIFSIESGLKYFVLGSFSSGIFLFGASILYGIFGLYNFSDIFFLLKYNSYIHISNFFFTIGLLFFIITLFFKLSSVPFHIWVPDVYEGAPTIITFFFSIIPKIVFLGFLMRMLVQIFDFSFNNFVYNFIMLGSISSLVLGSVLSLVQRKIKRLFAYSSISNVGFLLIGPSTVNLEGFNASIIFLFFYSLILIVLFYLFISVRYLHNNFKFKNINELFGFLNNNFLICFFLLINLFSLIGIPPLAGFFGKFYLFLVAFASSLETLFLSALYGSIVSAVVYLRLIRIIYFNKNVYFFSYFFDYYSLFLILSLISFLNLFFFLQPSLIFNFSYNILLFLF